MPQRHTTRRRAILAAAVLGLTTVAASAAAGAASEQGRPDHVLAEDMRGEAAIQALGNRLPEVAAQNGMTAREFREELRHDNALWVGRTGQLLFVDEAEVTVDEGDGPEAPALAEYPLSETFQLHSRPGSDKTIFLDFDGHDVDGTAWDTGNNNTVAEPYTLDGSPGFNDLELANIQTIWKHMAEDFSNFDVNVTTQDPGYAAINRSSSSDQVYGTRLVITPTTDIYSCGCGGVAYVGVFDSTGSTHDYYQPAFVFTVGGYPGTNPKGIAEAGSHEVGHNLGLGHDGTSSTGYYSGHDDWAPIMGVGYYRDVTHWSNGDYAGANNTQDDFGVMQNNGLALMLDDHGDGAGTATAITGNPFQELGLIADRNDVDVFSFTTGGGEATINADPAFVSPNLNIELTLRDSGGSLVAVDDDPSGLGASISVTLASGTYTVHVDGVGTSAYSDYGSTGRYVLHGSFGGAPSPPPPNQAPTAVAEIDGPSSGEAPFTAQFRGDSSSDPDGDPLSYTWSDTGQDFATTPNASRTFETPGVYEILLSVSDGQYTSIDTVTVTVTAPPPPPASPPAAPTGASALVSGADVVVSWTDASDNETTFEIYRERQHKNGSWRGLTLVGTVGADVESWTDVAPSANTYRYLVRAVNLGGSSSDATTDAVTVTDSSGGGDTGGGGGGGGNGGGKGKKPR